MKHRFLLGAFLVSFVIFEAFIPSSTSAQTSPTWGDGDMVSQEEYYRWVESNPAIKKRIEQLPATPVASLPIPILFGVAPSDLSPNFGDPRSGGRSHEGEDIMALKGTPIVSPTKAVVLSTGVWPGAGNYVSTANPGGETFVYMHLDRIADLDAGDALDPGDLIGYVGNTGNAAGGAAHLHFEIRKKGPTDPFPRLKGEFSLAQKIDFIENMLEDVSDQSKLVKFLVANYRGQFLAAETLGIDLPKAIEKEMNGAKTATAADPSPTPAAETTVASSPADLELGSHGSEVIALQKFLISQDKGPAARALANSGTTGNFGSVTRSALIEYQKAMGISPANGYYGPLTRAYAQQAKPVTVASAPKATTATVAIPNRDLELGANGDDVAWLQKFLIDAHSGPKAEALSRSGATGYFGPATKAALAEYQAKAGISPKAGYFGPSTRAYVASLTRVI